MDFGLLFILSLKTIDFSPNFYFYTIHFGLWPNFHPHILDYGFWSNFSPNTVEPG